MDGMRVTHPWRPRAWLRRSMLRVDTLECVSDDVMATPACFLLRKKLLRALYLQIVSVRVRVRAHVSVSVSWRWARMALR